MNIFEGARRVAMLVGALWIAFVIILIFDEPWGSNWADWLKGGIGVLVMLLGGLVSLYLLSLVTGWITRGFLGIPRGKDSRN
jgi:hypothetical protein